MDECGHNNSSVKTSLIRIRIPDEVKEQFKEYCKGKGTTMSTILLDYISILLPKNKANPVDPPPEKKNSVKKTEDPPKYLYCACGLDLLTLSTQDRILHVQTCSDLQKQRVLT